MSASLIADICSWILNALITSTKLVTKANSPAMAVGSLASLAGFVIVMVYVARPVVVRIVKRTPTGELVSEASFLGVVLAALVAAFVTETIGYASLTENVVCNICYRKLLSDIENVFKLIKGLST